MGASIGVVGLGVMGANLARNIERQGFSVVGYDLDPARTRAFLEGPAAGLRVTGVDSPDALMGALETPRRVLMMVPAGAAVDSAIAHLVPHLSPGDILIDGGNSWFLDTERRSRQLATQGFQFVGTGVSGGEEGALWGPSIMPGGQREAYDALAPIFRAIAAKAEDGEPCVAYMGPLGAGHYVKMVHNGIEYGDMQLIAETYDLLRRGLGLSAADLHEVFAAWNEGELKSYLIEITAEILTRVDEETGRPLVDVILDEAAQKGTGKWTSQNALDVGAPIPTINAAVESRILSGLKAERAAASRVLRGPGARLRRITPAIDRCGPRRALREQDHVVRAGDGAAAPRLGRVWLRHAAGRGREDLARRMHHPREPARGHHDGVPARPRAAEPAARRCLPRRRRAAAGCVAVRGADRGRLRDSGAGARRVARLLRRVPQRATPRQSDAGSARLLRRAHLPPRGPRRRVPRRVAQGAHAAAPHPPKNPIEPSRDSPPGTAIE